ncbi:hypothetical protein [Glycomyces harbinensis]|nr:hypothetical protein [Glycomyces harbinensis]
MATRVHRRAEPMPRLPFAVALAVAVVALVVALEFSPPSEQAAAEVDERPSNSPEVQYDTGYTEEEVALEIVEFGISKVVVNDLERLIIGAVVRNPYDRDLSAGALSLTAESERGDPVRIEDFYIGTIPPETSMNIGFVASGGGELPVERFELKAIEPSFLYSTTGGFGEGMVAAPTLPEVTLLETEPLLSPDGYRLRYQVDAVEATDVQISVLFRDGEGRLLGGIPAGAEPFSRFHDGWSASYLPVEAGRTLQHVDIPTAWIPEGADPDRFEVGPSA